MGIAVMIMGESGTGKSTSIRNLKGAGVVNVYGKPLPFKSDPERLKIANIDDWQRIAGLIIDAKADVIVVDDFQGLLVTQFMGRAKEKGYDKFTDMALAYYNVIKSVRSAAPEKRVYFLSHIERDQHGHEKVKTLGRMLDEKITVEGLFTIVLKTAIVNGGYFFQTRNSGFDTVKSPMDMFKEDLIPNDLAEVDRAICGYYNIDQQGEKK